MRLVCVFVFAIVLATAAAAQGKSELDNPAVPIAPASATQPANAVLNTAGIPNATDSTPEDSPMSARHVGLSLKAGSTISMQLTASIDSGTFKNGDAIHGTLTSALKTTSGVLLPAGTSVDGTVVSAAKAGTVQSGGELSLQLTRVGKVAVVTDVVDFDGQEGHKDLPDAAPARGTEAVAQAGATLQFHVLENGRVPGIVPGATLANTGGGGKTGGNATPAGRPPAGQPGTGQPGAGQPSTGQPSTGQPSTGQPSTGAGVNQTPIHGGVQPKP